MKFKEHIKDNIKSFEFDTNLEPVWENIEKELPKKPKGLFDKVGNYILIGATLIVIVLLYFSVEKSEIKEKRQSKLIYASLVSELTSQKILAINDIQNQEYLDYDVASTLIQTLKEDSSINVKMAAARALKGYMDQEEVRIGVIETLEQTENAYLKIKLINLLKDVKAQESLPVLETIIRGETGYLKKEALEGKREILTI